MTECGQRTIFQRGESGQAFLEYLLLLACLAIALVGIQLAWQMPLAHYLDRIAHAIARLR